MSKKEVEQIKARHLRKRGLSLKEIAKELKVAKSSVSTWVKDVKLTKNQLRFLGHKAHLKEVVRKRVETRLKNENIRRRLIMDAHKDHIRKINFNKEVLKVLGTTLYWAEGGKSQKNRSFNFTNSDPLMVRVMLVFIRIVCKIHEDRLRGHIHLHSHLNPGTAEKYWSSISKIPVSQFYKTTQIINKSSKNTRDTLPYGTFSIQIGSTDLFLKMLAWIEVITEKVTTQYG